MFWTLVIKITRFILLTTPEAGLRIVFCLIVTRNSHVNIQFVGIGLLLWRQKWKLEKAYAPYCVVFVDLSYLFYASLAND